MSLAIRASLLSVLFDFMSLASLAKIDHLQSEMARLVDQQSGIQIHQARVFLLFAAIAESHLAAIRRNRAGATEPAFHIQYPVAFRGGQAAPAEKAARGLPFSACLRAKPQRQRHLLYAPSG